MGLASLSISGLRCIEQAHIEPAPGLNLLVGKNASGKTSLLEGIFMLGRGRSFRSARREAVIRQDTELTRVAARLADAGHRADHVQPR